MSRRAPVTPHHRRPQGSKPSATAGRTAAAVPSPLPAQGVVSPLASRRTHGRRTRHLRAGRSPRTPDASSAPNAIPRSQTRRATASLSLSLPATLSPTHGQPQPCATAPCRCHIIERHAGGRDLSLPADSLASPTLASLQDDLHDSDTQRSLASSYCRFTPVPGCRPFWPVPVERQQGTVPAPSPRPPEPF
jgi:hypothetical protein